MRGSTEIRAFTEAMHYNLNLPKNARKGTWKGCSPGYLLWLLFKEYCELVCAVVHLAWCSIRYERRQDPMAEKKLRLAQERVLLESADVGNFSLMVADTCGALVEKLDYLPPKKKQPYIFVE